MNIELDETLDDMRDRDTDKPPPPAPESNDGFTDEEPLGPFRPMPGVPPMLEEARRIDHAERNMVLAGVREMIALQKQAAKQAKAEERMARSFRLSTKQEFVQVFLDIERLDGENERTGKEQTRQAAVLARLESRFSAVESNVSSLMTDGK